ncbi:MAG: hypothetical protein ACHP7P_14050 [Terriglobales bacterium]
MPTDPLAQVAAAEKQAETALKQPAKVNWLYVVIVGLVANVIGVLLHI